MKISYIFFSILFLTFSVQASEPTKDKNAGIKSQELIYGDEVLSKLDETINVVYQSALKLSHDPNKLRQSQIQWLKNRPVIGADLKQILEDYYTKRTIELLGDGNLRIFFLRNFFQKNQKIPVYIVSLSIIALINEQITKFEYDSISSLVQKFNFISLTPNKFIILLSPTEGMYRFTYEFFLLSFDYGLQIATYNFVQPKTFKLENDKLNALTGDFQIDRDKKLLHYNVHPKSYVIGNKCTWKLQETGGKLISEQKE